MKKQSGEVIENTGSTKKQTENKPKTKRAMLLKTDGGRNNKAKTNPGTKLAILLKIKGHEKNEPKANAQVFFSNASLRLADWSTLWPAVFK